MEDKRPGLTVQPFGSEYLEDIVIDQSVSGMADNCHTIWWFLGVDGKWYMDGATENDPCGS